MKHVTYVFHFLLKQIMDDVKRKNNKIKRKREVKNVISIYLQKRNYCTLQTFIATKKQHLTRSLVETAVGRYHSILYHCDPVVIDQNFTKFLHWLRDQTKLKNRFHDIENIVAPLFCLLYTEILRYEDNDSATNFFERHFPLLNENKCDNTIRDLVIKPKEKDISRFKEKFKSNRIVLQLNPESLKHLKKFVLESCHIVFVQVLQTYFDFQIDSFGKKEKNMPHCVYPEENPFHKFSNAIKDLRKETTPIFNLCINNCKQDILCALLKRQGGIVVFAENNCLHLMPLHYLDSILHLSVYSRLKFTNHSNSIYCVDISLDNRTLVSGSADRTICIYNLESMSLVKKCSGHLDAVCCVKISDNGSYVASGSADGSARLWQAKKGKLVRIFCGHTQTLTCIVFHPNSLYVATGSADRNIRLWCINKANSLRLLHASKGIIYDLAFSPCGKLLASASEDKSIRVWDLVTSKVVTELKCKDFPILKIIWNQEGSEICGGTLDGIIKIWNVSRTQDNCEKNKYIEPIITHLLAGKLLSIDYAFGTYGILTA